MSRVVVSGFSPKQYTPSFPFAPQRDQTAYDLTFADAAGKYSREWLSRYHCLGCSVHGCPQCQKPR